MNYKKILKRTIGIILLFNIIPLACILTTIERGEINTYGYLIPYIGGIIITICAAIFVGFLNFIFWCFE